MRFQKQLIPHTDIAEGKWDDNLRTTLACFLDMNPEEVPHFTDNHATVMDAEVAMNNFLHQYNAVLFEVQSSGTLQQVLNYMAGVNPDVFYMLTGYDENDKLRTVIGFNSDIVWDTHCDNHSLVSPCMNGHYVIRVFLNAVYHLYENEVEVEEDDYDYADEEGDNSVGRAEDNSI